MIIAAPIRNAIHIMRLLYLRSLPMKRLAYVELASGLTNHFFLKWVNTTIHRAKTPKYTMVSVVSGALPSLLSITIPAHPIHIALPPFLSKPTRAVTHRKARDNNELTQGIVTLASRVRQSFLYNLAVFCIRGNTRKNRAYFWHTSTKGRHPG